MVIGLSSFFYFKEDIMKERIEKKLEERIEYILNKNVEEITSEEFGILDLKLSNMKYEETKEEKEKEFAELFSKILIK